MALIGLTKFAKNAALVVLVVGWWSVEVVVVVGVSDVGGSGVEAVSFVGSDCPIPAVPSRTLPLSFPFPRINVQ